MPNKLHYRTLIAVTAGAAGLAGIGYLLYHYRSKLPKIKNDQKGIPTSTISETKNKKSLVEDDALVIENEFEIVGSQNAEMAPPVANGTREAVESEESEPLIHGNTTQKKVLVLGLDRAGKTCLLSAIASEEQPQLYEATPGFNVMCITANGVDLSIWEIGGDCKYRGYWENFLKDTSVLIFVVDSTDTGRLSEVKEEINRVLAKEEMDQVPLLVVCTKQDRQTVNKLSLDDISEELELSLIQDRKVIVHGVEVKCGGAASNKGLQELQDLIADLCSTQSDNEED